MLIHASGKPKKSAMLHHVGRLLQFVGLFVILPLAIAGQVMERLTVGQMFVWTAVGAIVFYFGGTLLRKSG